MQALLGLASRGGTRAEITRECGRLLTGGGPYAGSSEEMTPVRLDWISAVPLAMTVTLLLASPGFAMTLAKGGFGAHLLDVRSIRNDRERGFCAAYCDLILRSAQQRASRRMGRGPHGSRRAKTRSSP